MDESQMHCAEFKKSDLKTLYIESVYVLQKRQNCGDKKQAASVVEWDWLHKVTRESRGVIEIFYVWVVVVATQWQICQNLPDYMWKKCDYYQIQSVLLF